MSKILSQLSALKDTAAVPPDGSQAAPPAALERLTERILALKPEAAHHVAELGTLLKDVKELLGHGSFVAWLADVVGMTRSTATKYMRAVELENIAVLEPLGVEKLYLLRALDNVNELRPDSTLPTSPGQAPQTLMEMSTRELRVAVQALSPGRPARRPMRRDLVQRYVHLREELGRVVEQLNNGDDAAQTRFHRSTGQTAARAAEIVVQLP